LAGSATRKDTKTRRSLALTLLVGLVVTSLALAAVAIGPFGEWSEAVGIESFGPGADESFNTPALEGCPFISPDGKMFFMASNRPGGMGGLDIWVSTRKNTNGPWGPPKNLGPPINTEHNDFCPTIGRDGRTFFFVSNRPGHCGDTPNADIYQARFNEKLEVAWMKHLGCEVNSQWDEHSPFPINMPGLGPVLFYSSTRAGLHDIYMSRSQGGIYRPGEVVGELNTASNDAQPNVRRDGLEIFFWSDRPGSQGPDIYSATRSSVHDPWSKPVNLGPAVNSAFGETRPSLSWDGTTLYFGSTRFGGQSDVYVTTR
jgi:Tol biopolymer transport system component